MNEPVLLLNRNFEPLNVCNTRRAVVLLMVGKAELVENGRGHIRTANSTYPRPSVIRLTYLIHRPRGERGGANPSPPANLRSVVK